MAIRQPKLLDLQFALGELVFTKDDGERNSALISLFKLSVELEGY
jgi:hypothetical protein